MSRLEQLRAYMEENHLDAFYVAKPANVRCISGYTGEDSFLLSQKEISTLLQTPGIASRLLTNARNTR